MGRASAGLAGLGALRGQLAQGPAVRRWVSMQRADLILGGMPVTRYAQRVGRREANPTLLLEGAGATLTLEETESGPVRLTVTGFAVSTRQGERVVEHADFGPSVRVGDRVLRTCGDQTHLDVGAVVEVGTTGGPVLLRIVDAEPIASSAEPVTRGARATTRTARRELIVEGGVRLEKADLELSWLEVRAGATLRCLGEVRAEAAVIEGTLTCNALTAVYLHVDGSTGAAIEAPKVRAHVLDLVQRALEPALRDGSASADFVQHFGGELNPSWDEARGSHRLRPDLASPGVDGLYVFDQLALRAALLAGESLLPPGQGSDVEPPDSLR